MPKLSIKLVNSSLEESDFDCDNPQINTLIKGSFFNYVNQIAYTYEMCMDDTPLGYYMIQLKSINSGIPEEISDYWDASLEMSVPCLYIHLIAIDKKYQKQGYGKLLMKHIISTVFNMIEYVPIRMILLKAVADKVTWYEQLGFTKLTSSEGFEEYMYIDCITSEHRADLKTFEEEE